MLCSPVLTARLLWCSKTLDGSDLDSGFAATRRSVPFKSRQPLMRLTWAWRIVICVLASLLVSNSVVDVKSHREGIKNGLDICASANLSWTWLWAIVRIECDYNWAIPFHTRICLWLPATCGNVDWFQLLLLVVVVVVVGTQLAGRWDVGDKNYIWRALRVFDQRHHSRLLPASMETC